MSEYISLEEIKTAYKKYKGYVYYDNTSLFMRQQIAEFESSDFENRLLDLHGNLVNIDFLLFEENEYINKLIQDMSYWKLPKRIPNENNSANQLLTNYRLNSNIEINDYIYYVNAPIELHIICVLWIMKEGQYLVEKLDFNYGYVLDRTENNNIVNGLRLFTPYYNEYQKWRDRAITSAKNILKEKQNIGIISLDIKNFYHSVRLDFTLIEKELYKKQKETTLSKLLSKIYQFYTNLFNEKEVSSNNSILPIGFLSSSILANWYLIDFDKKINEKISPVYYGRYVDDILLTVPLGKLSKYKDSKDLIKDLFEVNDILLKEEKEIDTLKSAGEHEIIYKLVDYECLEIQQEKIIIMLLDKNEPTSVLDKFKNEIRKSSSEYRFLPNEDLMNENFEEASSKLIYDGSKNKLRSIKEFQDDKFGISAFLAKRIFLALQSKNNSNKESANQIINFFRNSRCLEYSSLWEKIITYFILTNDIFSIKLFRNNILKALSLISNGDKKEVIDNYKNQFSIAISLSLSIKPDFYKKNDFFNDYIELAEKFRNAKMVRKNYSKTLPLSDLINHKDFKDNEIINPEFLVGYDYYPRYIHYHEILLLNYLCNILNDSIEKKNVKIINQESQEIFNSISNSNKNTLNYMDKIIEDKIFTIQLQENKFKNKLKVAVANFNIDSKIFTPEYIRKADINPDRKKDFINILNQAEKEKVDLLVLPECSIPFSWLYWIVDFAHKRQIGLVFGLEHIISKSNYAYNLMVTLLPVNLQKYNSLHIDIRVKKHYSPEEERILKGYGYKIPNNTNDQLIFNWNNIHFTTFNCFELANISDRAKYKSKIDLLIASEYNRDIEYFSNIVESSSRDLHCYVVQSNNAEYGDNRIYSPSKEKYERDIVKVKGGENSTLLVGTLDIKKLREFQIKEYELQRSDKFFKPTPPDYNKQIVKERILNSEDLERE